MKGIMGTLQGTVHVLDTDQLAECLDHTVGFDTMTCKMNNMLLEVWILKVNLIIFPVLLLYFIKYIFTQIQKR